jgi:hypothetical protein
VPPPDWGSRPNPLSAAGSIHRGWRKGSSCCTGAVIATPVSGVEGGRAPSAIASLAACLGEWQARDARHLEVPLAEKIAARAISPGKARHSKQAHPLQFAILCQWEAEM